MPYEKYDSSDFDDNNSDDSINISNKSKRNLFTRDYDPSILNSQYQQPQDPPRDNKRLLLIVLHLTLIIGAFLLIYIIFVSPLIFEDSTNFSLTGELDNFSTQLNQSIILNVQNYNLKLEERTELSGEKETFTLSNFTGELFLENQSLKLIGHSSKIETSNSIINAQDQQITLKFERGGVNLVLENLSMQISKNLDISYSPDLVYSTNKKTNITISNFNGTLSHDSLIGLYGKVDSFTIKNNISNIEFN